MNITYVTSNSFKFEIGQATLKRYHQCGMLSEYQIVQSFEKLDEIQDFILLGPCRWSLKNTTGAANGIYSVTGKQKFDVLLLFLLIEINEHSKG